MKNERRNKRLYKIISCFVVFLVCVFAFVSLATSKTQNKVKADTPTVFYYDVAYNETQNLVEFYIYVLDAYQNLTTDSCQLDKYYANRTPPYYYGGASTIITFTRLTSGDSTDYDCYVGYISITSSDDNANVMYRVFTTQLRWDNTQVCTNTLACLSPYNIEMLREEIYNNAYNDGYQDGTNDRDVYWDDYIQETYESTTGRGYQRIFEEGKQAGIDANIGTQNWFIAAFSAVDSFLNIRIFPNITFGVLLGIPFVISIVWFIIRMFRGGGGGD